MKLLTIKQVVFQKVENCHLKQKGEQGAEEKNGVKRKVKKIAQMSSTVTQEGRERRAFQNTSAFARRREAKLASDALK